MSSPLWMNAGKETPAIGTATIEADDELLTIATHGLADGDTVTVDTLIGGAVGSLVVDAVYFVRDATTNTFALSLSRLGPLVTFASDGGADVYRFAPQYNARELRQAMSGLLMPGRLTGVDPAVDHRFGAKSGVLSWRFAELIGRTITGGTWSVGDFVAAVYTGTSQLAGTYIVAVPADSGGYDPPDATNPRIDALDLRIRDDDEDASGFRDSEIVYVAGTPAGSPTAPAVTANSLRLFTFQVATSGVVTILTEPPLAVARGGILPIRDASERPASNRAPGMAVWYIDEKRLEVNTNGSTEWVTIPPVKFAPVETTTSSDVAVSDSGTTVVTSPSVTFDGSTPAKVTIKWYGVHNDGDPAATFLQLRIRRGTTVLDQIVLRVESTAAHLGGEFSRTYTPPSGAATHNFFAIPLTASGAHVIDGGTDALISIRVEPVFA